MIRNGRKTADANTTFAIIVGATLAAALSVCGWVLGLMAFLSSFRR
jgi:hypothetical protein